MEYIDEKEWIEVRKSSIPYYNEIDLYYQSTSREILLYKQAGLSYDQKYQKRHPYLGKLFISAVDKLKGLAVVQEGFSRNLSSKIAREELREVKEELVGIMEETLSHPRGGSLKEIPKTVGSIVEDFSTNPSIIKKLAYMSHVDYTTTIHSINVMALTMNFCFYRGMDRKRISSYGMAALLHDVGKSEVPIHLLRANRRLSDDEFKLIQEHTLKGKEILGNYDDNFTSAITGAMEHHEKLDGSGYPLGIRNISECGQILGIIDCYEAITNDDRPYRNAMLPLKALELLKNEVEKGHFDKDIFNDFAYSLVDRDR